MGKILVVNSGLFKARLLKTGQLTSYGSGTGVDDGAYRKGIARAYLILTTGRFAGTTTIPLNAKNDIHSNNCVLDRKTGLLWSRYVAASIGPLSDGKLPWTTAAGEGIFDYVAAANAAQLAAYSDWRIPNVFELASIADHEAPNSLPDASAFPSWPGSAYVWSSTTRSSGTTQAFEFHFQHGYSITDPKTVTYFTALVRGG